MFKTASLLEGCDKGPWELNDNNLSTRHHLFLFFFFSIFHYFHLMSLFLVPKLPVVYSVHSFHQYFLILMTFHGRSCSLECQHCFPQPEAVGREGERRERDAGREGKDVSITQKDPEVQDVMTPTVGIMINALIYIQLPLDSFRKLW